MAKITNNIFESINVETVNNVFPDISQDQYNKIISNIQNSTNLKCQVLFNWLENNPIFGIDTNCIPQNEIISSTKTIRYNILEQNNKPMFEKLTYSELKLCLTLIEYLKLSKSKMFTIPKT